MKQPIDEPITPESENRTTRVLDAHTPREGQGSVGADRWRELALQALQTTKNPQYVLARYGDKPGCTGMTIARLELALEKMDG